MTLLITGAFPIKKEETELLEKIGYEIDFQQDERDKNAYPEKYEAVICNGLFLYNNIADFKNLKLIQLTSAGRDRVDIEYIKNHNIKLFSAADAYSIPMAEWALAGILNVYKNLSFFYNSKKNKLWVKDRNIREISGAKAIIFGYGNAGRETAKRLSAFGCKITACDIVKKDLQYADDFCFVDDSDNALREADIIILTLPLVPETEKFMDSRRLSLLKHDALLVNIARGGLTDEKALISALKSGRLKNAVLDVFAEEPLQLDSELWDIDGIVLTPHNSFVGNGNHSRLFNIIKNNLAGEV